MFVHLLSVTHITRNLVGFTLRPREYMIKEALQVLLVLSL